MNSSVEISAYSIGEVIKAKYQHNGRNKMIVQLVKELKNLGATNNVALFFSFIHMLLKKIKHYP